MFGKYGISILIMLLIVSCKNEVTYQVPSNVIPEEPFINLLADLYIAESVSGLNIKNVGANQFDSVYNFNPIADNGFTKAKFDSSLNFYSKHPIKFKELHEKAIEKIAQKQYSHDFELQQKNK